MGRTERVGYWETKRIVDRLKRLSAHNAAPSIVAPALDKAMIGVTFSAMTITNEYLYRSRWNIPGRLFNNVSELSYKPQHLVDRKGRLNDIGESTLYAAACEIGTILESRFQYLKPITIAKLKALNKELLYTPIGLKDRHPYYSDLSRGERMVIDYCYGEITNLVENDYEYNSTIAIANHFLRKNLISEKGKQKLGVIYPSVEGSKICNQRTYNVAMLPEVFDRNFKIVGATVYILSREKNHIQLNDVNIVNSVNEDGGLNWRYSYEEMVDRIRKGATIGEYICKSISDVPL